MSHIHEKYDYVVSVFITYKDKILLVYHHNYDKWLPLGGHVELDEDPEVALYREIKEESGLKVRILSTKQGHLADSIVKPILTPNYVDVHQIKGDHKHIAFIYFGTTSSPKVKLCIAEHSSFKWFHRHELNQKKYQILPSIKFYCQKAMDLSKLNKRKKSKK